MFELTEKDVDDSIQAFVQYLTEAVDICSDRGLAEASMWALEMVLSYNPPINRIVNKVGSRGKSTGQYEALLSPAVTEADSDQYCYALSLFKSRDYSYVIDVLKDAQHQKHCFLRFYSKYKLYERRSQEYAFDRLASGHDILTPTVVALNELEALHEELSQHYNENRLDAFGLYLYGAVLLKQYKIQQQINLKITATRILLESVRAYPYNWSAWLELASTVSDHEQFVEFQLLLKNELVNNAAVTPPAMIMVNLILIKTCNTLGLNIDLYVEIIEYLKLYYFATCPFLIAEWAKHLNVNKDPAGAVLEFKKLREAEPTRWQDMDVYSNILFHLADKNELKDLADAFSDNSEETVETSIIKGNHCKIHNRLLQSNKHFTRAIMLQRDNFAAWIGLGHNFLELDDPMAALKAYSGALAIKRRYIAYFGLGRSYERMRATNDAILCYKKASSLCGDDWHAWNVLGDSFQKLGRKTLANECFAKANHFKTEQATTL